MEIITTRSVGAGFVEVNQDFLLDETPRTKIVFRAAMHQGGIRGDIIKYRKDANGNWGEPVPISFNTLHEDDGIKITLPTEAVSKFYQSLEELRILLSEKGVRYGEHRFTIADADALIVNNQNKSTLIRKLVEADLGEEVLSQLTQNVPEIATRWAQSRIQENRNQILLLFEQMLDDDSLLESHWQEFFEENTWIFGYGLRYQILRCIQSQPNYGGQAITGTGGQRGDFLTTTEANVKFTCLVEIKRPSTHLLGNTYRNGVWPVSNELAGAISQVQVNCAQWELNGARTEQNRELMAGMNTVSPKGIVIVGNSSELNDWDKRNSFERFRREIRNPEIITYDELYERAKFIVGDLEPHQEAPDEDDDLPF